MSRRFLPMRALAVSAIASFLLASGTALAAAPPPKPAGGQPGGGPVPAPKILVIDRSVIIRASKAGQDVVRQANGLMQSAQSEFRNEAAALQKEGRALQQQVAILAPDVKARKLKDFQAKQAAFQKKVGAREGLIQGGIFKARQQMEQALGPILKGIMQERGANLLLDRNAVVLGTVNVDITGVAIQRLDQKLPSAKVQLTALPPALQAQMAQQGARR